jgi:hypothetical protein
MFGRSGKGGRRRNLILSVIAAYVLIGGLAGLMIFRGGGDSAKANETAFVSSSIRLGSERELSVGDKIEIYLTLQNTSITESVNDLSVDFFSTKDAVNWEELTGGNMTTVETKIKAQKNSFRLPVLSSGERVEYTVTGTLQNALVDYLTILAKIRFVNKEGSQEVNTNRVFTKLKDYGENSNDLISLETNKSDFTTKETIQFSVSKGNLRATPADLKGKLYISRKDTGDVINSLNCAFDENSQCTANLPPLPAGYYSAIFQDESQNFYSNIGLFRVNGPSLDFVPNSQAVMDFPFGTGSINGIVPVRARRVVSFNDSPKPIDQCTFDVSKGSKVVYSTQAAVNQDRTCYAVLDAGQFVEADGVYTVSLRGVDQKKDISFVRKSPQLLQLRANNLIIKNGQDVDLEINSVQDALGGLMTNSKAIVGIWHPASGDYKEISSLNGDFLMVKDGAFRAVIPNDYFKKGGLYQVYVKLDDGQISDFLTLNFDDKTIGTVDSGVIVDNYNSLRVGQPMIFTLNGVKDRAGNPIVDALCGLNLYQSGKGVRAVTINGQIKNGQCKVKVDAGRITTAGPLLVSFTGNEIENKINQSRQLNIAPGEATSYGGLNLEYEPARKGYANNLLVGPVTDIYGNPTNVFDMKVGVYAGSEVKYELTNINVVDGYAKVVLPSSIMDSTNLILKIFDKNGRELISREITTEENDEKLILPNFPQELSGDENLKVGLSGIYNTNQKCKITYYRSGDKFYQTEVDVDSTSGSCTLNWSLDAGRDVKQALLKFQYGDKFYHSIIKLKSGEAGSLFVLTPQQTINTKNEVQFSILSSPISDRFGLPVTNGKVRIQYNGKVDEVPIKNGFARLDLVANKLDTKDIRQENNQRFLELSLDAKAGVLALSKTNSVSVYLGDRDIANSLPNFKVISARTQLQSGQPQILQFVSETCEAYLISSRNQAKLATTHRQNDTCMVQLDGEVGDYSLVFSKDGNSYGEFSFQINNLPQSVVWCQEKKNCIIQVRAAINSKIQAILYDDDKQYQFNGEELDNIVTIKQNGLNPLKEYLVEIRYLNSDNQPVSFFKMIQGEKMLE